MRNGQRTLCVFCGSSSGFGEVFKQAAHELGAEIGRRELRLVYGGARVGVMGALADAALAHGAHVVGIMPKALMARREVTHEGLNDFVEVGSMAERKAEMLARSDAFCALPGGVGTLDELFEVLCGAAIGQHDKPCGLFDVAGYFAPLLDFFDGATAQGFIPQAQREQLVIGRDAAGLLDALLAQGDVR